MNTETLDRSARMRTLWLGFALLLVIMIGGAFATRSARPEAALAIGWAYGLGTFAMAWLTARVTPFPRWAWLATAGVMTVGLVASASTFPGHAWTKEWQSLAWMNPGLILFASLEIPSARTGWCAPGGRWAGAILLGAGTLYTLLLLAIRWL